MQLGHAYKELGELEDAGHCYQAALLLAPHDDDLHLQIGHLEKVRGNFGRAALAYQRSMELNPRNGDAIAEYLALAPKLNLPILPVTSPGDPSGAVQATAVSDNRIQLSPLVAFDDPRAAEELRCQGDRARAEQDWNKTADAYRAYLQIVPDDYGIWVQLGHALKESGDLAAGEAAYRKALALAPDEAEILLQLGHILKLQGRHAEAIAAYDHATKTKPSLEDAWRELFRAGNEVAQQRFSDMQVAHGGIEALLTLTDEVARLQAALARVAKALPEVSAQSSFPLASYDRYRRIYDVPAAPPSKPCNFTVILRAADTSLDTLYSQIASLEEQTCGSWQLLVIGSDVTQRRAVERAAASDARIRWVDTENRTQSGFAERHVALTLSADWIVLVGTGMLLHPEALAWCAAVVGVCGAIAFVSDEETVSAEFGALRRSEPLFRQVLDYDTLLEANPFGETIIVSRSAYVAVADELVIEPIAAARSSLLLSLVYRGSVGHIPLPLVAYDAGNSIAPNSADSLATGRDLPRKPERSADHRKAVQAHLAHTGRDGQLVVGDCFEANVPVSILWQPDEPNQILQLIILTRDNADDVRNFVETLLNRAAVPNAIRFLIVDNGSRQPETPIVLAELSKRERVKVVAIDEPFNWSRLNNQAAKLTDAELLVFANDDMQMLSDGWDCRLRGLLARQEIGAVGARLLYPGDDTVQHAGVLLGWPGIAIHDGQYEAVSDCGPGSRWHLTRAASAVTGAFLAVRRETFEATGGFDEIGLPVAYSDIDFCMKLRARGLKILWTPSITLYHHESKTRGLDNLDPEKSARNAAESKVMRRRWGAALESDPSVNPIWKAVTLPFRLIAAPSQASLWRHVRLCASPNPWLPSLSHDGARSSLENQ